MEETNLLRSERGPVVREGCGVPQNGGNGPPTTETGVLLIGRGVAYRKTDETYLLRSKRGSCSSGGVWPSTVYCSSSPPHHGVLFIHPSTGTPPPSTVHPALHHTTASCSSTGNATAHCSSNPPPHTHTTLTVHPRGSIDRL